MDDTRILCSPLYKIDEKKKNSKSSLTLKVMETSNP